MGCASSIPKTASPHSCAESAANQQKPGVDFAQPPSHIHNDKIASKTLDVVHQPPSNSCDKHSNCSDRLSVCSDNVNSLLLQKATVPTRPPSCAVTPKENPLSIDSEFVVEPSTAHVPPTRARPSVDREEWYALTPATIRPCGSGSLSSSFGPISLSSSSNPLEAPAFDFRLHGSNNLTPREGTVGPKVMSMPHGDHSSNTASKKELATEPRHEGGTSINDIQLDSKPSTMPSQPRPANRFSEMLADRRMAHAQLRERQLSSMYGTLTFPTGMCKEHRVSTDDHQ